LVSPLLLLEEAAHILDDDDVLRFENNDDDECTTKFGPRLRASSSSSRSSNRRRQNCCRRKTRRCCWEHAEEETEEEEPAKTNILSFTLLFFSLNVVLRAFLFSIYSVMRCVFLHKNIPFWQAAEIADYFQARGGSLLAFFPLFCLFSFFIGHFFNRSVILCNFCNPIAQKLRAQKT